jgi:hypothetical protein
MTVIQAHELCISKKNFSPGCLQKAKQKSRWQSMRRLKEILNLSICGGYKRRNDSAESPEWHAE